MIRKYFDSEVSVSSPVVDDYFRVVNYDENGHEFITYEKEDYPKFQSSLGFASDWSLDSLVKAGISPDFGISTGYASRSDGLDDLASISNIADSILNSENI